MTFSEIVIGIITNVFSSYLYEQGKQVANRRKLDSFVSELKEWAISFELKHDGTIITTGDFFNAVKNHNVVETIIAYYGVTSRIETNEIQFIEEQKKRLISLLRNRNLTYPDNSAINEFFESLCIKSKSFFEDMIPFEMRGLRFELFQEKANSQQVLDIVKNILDSVLLIQENSKKKERVLTEDNLEYYRMWLFEFTKFAPSLLYANLPLEGCYDEIISSFRERLAGLTWKQEVLEIIEEAVSTTSDSMQEDLSLFIKTASLIRSQIGYNVIWECIQPLISNPAFINAQGESKFSRCYNKVILVSGEPGSGKTHFLNELFRSSLQNDITNIVFIPLKCDDIIREAPVTPDKWERLLLRGLKNCFNTEIDNFDFFMCDGFFRLVFVIDDIHRLYLHRQDCFEQLMQSVTANTKYDFVVWVFTINQFDMYLLDSKNSILYNYIMRSSVENGLFKPSLNLTRFNEENSVGKDVLSLYNIKLSPFTFEAESQENTYRNGVCSPYNNPLYAHILGKSGVTEMLPHMTEYLGFIEGLVGCFDRRLKSPNVMQYPLVKSTIESIAKMSISKSKTSFNASEFSDISENNIAILRECGLLQRIEEIDDVFSLSNFEEVYGLYIDIYWILKIALVAHETCSNCISAYINMEKIIEY